MMHVRIWETSSSVCEYVWLCDYCAAQVDWLVLQRVENSSQSNSYFTDILFVLRS